MHVTECTPIGRVRRDSPGYQFYRGANGQAVPPLAPGLKVAAQSLEHLVEVTDAPAWIAGGDYVVFEAQLDRGTGTPVRDHVVLSMHAGQPNAWLVQDGGCYAGAGALALMPEGFRWDHVVEWSGWFALEAGRIEQAMLAMFPEIPWAIVFEDRGGNLRYRGQPELVTKLRDALTKSDPKEN